jgi:hypothetical protein
VNVCPRRTHLNVTMSKNIGADVVASVHIVDNPMVRSKTWESPIASAVKLIRRLPLARVSDRTLREASNGDLDPSFELSW